ncbi:hypothetical protein JYU34_013416 [Plutella xylostella]|uniref:Uncharacterized protein n=1 Tax=Plutella xylostella TaxID=51655 RepID=A0ABQ7Q9Q3_PLUXY|nr:hypothetical protein JYU34_013416 [Plutella xylostella]
MGQAVPLSWSIPIGRAAGPGELSVRPHPQPEPLLAVQPLERDRRPRLRTTRSPSEDIRDAAAVRDQPLLGSRVRLLPETLQGKRKDAQANGRRSPREPWRRGDAGRFSRHG